MVDIDKRLFIQKILLLYSAMIFPSCVNTLGKSAAPATKPPVQRNNHTIAHLFLNNERELGANQYDYVILDKFLDEISNIRFKGKPCKDFFTSVNSVLKRMNYSYDRELLFNSSLKAGTLDCTSSVILSIAAGELCNTPVKAVRVPRHVFARCGGYNQDNVLDRHISDDEYKRMFNIPEEAISKGFFLKSLSMRETFAIQFLSIGQWYQKIGDYDMSLSYYDRCVKSDPKFPEVYISMAVALTKLNRYDEAMEYVNIGLDMNRNEPLGYLNKGSIYYLKKEYSLAVKEFDRAIQLDPLLRSSHRMRKRAASKLVN